MYCRRSDYFNSVPCCLESYNFYPQDKESVGNLVKLIDKSNGYIFSTIDSSAVEFSKIAAAPLDWDYYRYPLLPPLLTYSNNLLSHYLYSIFNDVEVHCLNHLSSMYRHIAVPVILHWMPAKLWLNNFDLC
jgi:hypothetical protein